MYDFLGRMDMDLGFVRCDLEELRVPSVRLPVWWGRRGAAGPHPDLEGVTGRFVVIRHPRNSRGLRSTRQNYAGA